jgi:hypothetical protein
MSNLNTEKEVNIMKKVILVLILAFLVSIATPLNSYAGEYIGKYCFLLDNYPIERFVWEVEQVSTYH